MNIMKISCYNCFWCAGVWSIYVCERMLHRWYPYILTARWLKTEFLLLHPQPVSASRRIASLQSHHLLLLVHASWDSSSHCPSLSSSNSCLYCQGEGGSHSNKYVEEGAPVREAFLLSLELPWLAGEHWQDLALDQTQLFWAPGHHGCPATELVLAVLVFTP